MILLHVSTKLLSILFFSPHSLGQYLIWKTDAEADYELYQMQNSIFNIITNDSLKYKWSLMLDDREIKCL